LTCVDRLDDDAQDVKEVLDETIKAYPCLEDSDVFQGYS